MLTLEEIRDIIHPLTECEEVAGLCLMGSYAAGDANELSDLDIGVFFRDEITNLPEVKWPFAHDLWLVGRENRQRWSREGGWQASAFLSAQMLFDREGKAADDLYQIISAKDRTLETRAECWDGYLNGLYRSLKYRRKAREYGHRACAAESVLYFAKSLFLENGYVAPLPGRERAAMWRIHDKPIAGDDQQMELLTQILRDGSAEAQSALFAVAEPFLIKQGLGFVIDAWEGLLHLEIQRAAEKEQRT